MNIYLAARYSRYPEMQQYAKELTSMGHTVTSRWIYGGHDIATDILTDAERLRPQWAQEDWDDLAKADCCISFTEGPGDVPGRARGGRHCELGIALALDQRCVVIGYREHIFHWLPVIAFYETWEQFVAMVHPGPEEA